MDWKREALIIYKAHETYGTVRAVSVSFGLSIGKVSEFSRLGRALIEYPELETIKSATRALERLNEIELEITRAAPIRKRRRKSHS